MVLATYDEKKVPLLDEDSVSLAISNATKESDLSDDVFALLGQVDEASQCHSHGGAKGPKLNLLPFTVLMFYNVSGGPFGVEATIRAGGPLLSIVGFLLAPFVWSIPEALITTEMGASFPDASGGIAWVDEAFGHRVSKIMGLFQWTSGITDMAIYPVLFLDYLLESSLIKKLTGDDLMFWKRFSFLVLTATVLTLINYRGLEVVGKVSILIAVLSMSSFVVMCVIGSYQINTERWWSLEDNGDNIQWAALINNLYWNSNCFDAGASFSKEVADIKTVYIKGMQLSMPVVFLGTFLPLIVATGAVDSAQLNWEDGYLAKVGEQIGGAWLGNWIIFSSAVANIAQFIAEMSTDSFQIMGMAERGLIPKFFTRRSRYGTPIFGILICYLGIVLMFTTNFKTLLEILNINYSMSILLQYGAFIKLRIYRGDVVRPYRVPFNTFGCIIMIMPTILGAVIMIVMASKETYKYCMGYMTLGITLYLFQTFTKHRSNEGEYHPETAWSSQYDEFSFVIVSDGNYVCASGN